MTYYVYQACAGAASILAIEIERETDAYCFLPSGNRFAKQTTWERTFPSWYQARDWLVQVAEERVMSAERTLAGAKKYLADVQALQKPDLPTPTPNEEAP